MKRILITGGGGFVGRHLVEALGRSDWDVHVVSRSKSGEVDGVAWHPLDLFDRSLVADLVERVRPHSLVHLAWITEPAVYWTSSLNEAWKDATLHLFEAFLESGGRRALATGTSAEYDWGSTGPLLEDESPLSKQTLYSRCKLETMERGRELFSARGIPLIWARLFNPFGPGEHRRRLIPRACRALLRGETFLCAGPPSARDFLHVSEVADALLAAVESDFSGTLNIASGEGRTAQEVVRRLALNLGAEDRVRFEEAGGGSAQSVVACTRRLQDVIGFRPRLGFDEQIAEVCAWWKQQSLEEELQ